MRKSMVVLLPVILTLILVGVPICAFDDNPGPPPGARGFGPPPTEEFGDPSAHAGGEPSGMRPPGPPGPPRGPWRHRRGERGGGRGFLMRRLALTEGQLAQMRDKYVVLRDNTRKARSDLAVLKDEKMTMILSGHVDLEKMAKLDEEIVKTQAEIEREKLKMQRERLKLLTPDQAAKLSDFLANREMRGMMRQFLGRRHRGGLEGP